MSLLVPWLVFPLVLFLLALGCGLLLEVVTGVRLPGAIVAPVGLAVMIVVAGIATATDATAELATPAVVALATMGLLASPPWRRGTVDRGAVGCAVIVLAVFGAPVLLSGHATFAGYIKLD